MIEIDPRLRTELGQRAEQIEVTGDFAARAIEMEGRAQRRRVATATFGSALALAVTAPLVYSAMTPDASQPVPANSTTAPAPAPSSHAPTPTARATTSAAPRAIPTFDTAGKALATALPKLGPAMGTPDVPYAVDGVLHDSDHDVPVPARTGIWNLARMDHGGALVVWNTETGTFTSLVDASGKELASLAKYQSFAVSDDRSRLLVSGPDGFLRVLDSRGGTLAELRTADAPVALLGDLAFAQSNEGSDSIVWNTATGETRKIKGIVRDVNELRRIAVVLEPQAVPDFSNVCYSIVDVDMWATRSRACGPVAPMTFSPQGNYVLATGTHDGAGPISLAVIRVDDGRVALKIDDSIGAWTARMNEAETGVTFSASEGGPAAPSNNALVRCDLSGACIVVGDSRKMPMVNGLTDPVWSVTQN